MITMWYTRHLDILFSLMTRLLDADQWFDVRTIRIAEQWSITFNAEAFKVPPALARFLEKPEADHHPAKALPMSPRPRDIAEHKKMKAEQKKKRRGR